VILVERERFDVCVIGAGPAGATAACLLAKEGIDTLLVDRAIFPRDKVCGDGVGPRAVRVLEKLGLYPSEGFPGRFRLEGVRIGSPNRSILEVSIMDDPGVGAGYVIPRKRLDGWLLEQAVEKGAVLRDSMEVLQVEKRKGGIRVSGSRGGSRVSVQARFAIGSWGARAGRVARPHPSSGSGSRFSVVAVRAYFTGLQGIGPFMEIHFDPGLVPGYGWVFPTGPDSANIGYGMRLDRLQKKGIPLRQLFETFLDSNPSLRHYLQGGKRASSLRGAVIPFRKVGLPVALGRLLLAGDAAGFADPLSGEGIGTAMQSGWLAADCVTRALRRGTPERWASVAYAMACRKDILLNLGLGSLVQSIMIRPPFGSTAGILDAVVEKAQTNPRMARALARLIIGDLSRSAFLEAGNWRKLWKAWRQE
jgi:geranylgeranyl reductase family protein